MTRVIAIIFFTGLIFAAGCSQGGSQFRQGYDFTEVETVAVIDVVGPVGSEGAKNQIADFVVMELLAKGYAPIERSQIQSLLKEQEFQASGMTPEQGAVAAGRILNVPTVILVNIPQFKESISLTVKMLDVEDGSVLWVGSGSGTTGKTLGTILGAAAGAGAGATVSGDSSKNKTTGAIIGGVLGGATAHLLAPEKAEATQKIIKKLSKSLPNRFEPEKKKSFFGLRK
ncbi:MAG: glycine zipper 2TM domain-containing protein [Anaerohalosphaeraceae bacterium]|nr:glycine zipper 2TM domain-containing protein [Anaerohalosphaeraceae bacterium]